MKNIAFNEITQYISTLKGYDGYVQFSHRPIDEEKDIFINSDKITVCSNEAGFVYEAHFYKDPQSISIRYVDNSYIVSEYDTSCVASEDIDTYLSDIETFDYRIHVAQLWESEIEPLCENLKVPKLKALCFMGFEKGDS